MVDMIMLGQYQIWWQCKITPWLHKVAQGFRYLSCRTQYWYQYCHWMNKEAPRQTRSRNTWIFNMLLAWFLLVISLRDNFMLQTTQLKVIFILSISIFLLAIYADYATFVASKGLEKKC
ncbi:hypothetical protein OH492_10060 [Vibrio chagasii]|nr:hypothetical protein [Vibrio chagasii]